MRPSPAGSPGGLTDPAWPAPSSGITLAMRFTYASLLAALIVAALSGVVTARLVEQYALQNQANVIARYVSELAAPRLAAKDFLAAPGARRNAFQAALGRLIGRVGITGITIWNGRGQVVYSSSGALPATERSFPMPARLALRGGTLWRLVPAPRGVPTRLRQIETFAPATLNGTAVPVGVYDVVSSLTDLAPALQALEWAIWGSVVFGMLLLYGLLFTIVRSASRKIESQHEALKTALAGVIRSLISAVDARDVATADHSSQVSNVAMAIGRGLGLEQAELYELQVAGLLHDVGKIGISDMILNKPGPLTGAERKAMQRHALMGYEILKPVAISERIKQAVLHSHERWDGTGYPDGLAGTQIPLTARILAVADAFGALTVDRPYRLARGTREAVVEIAAGAGILFDPDVVGAFLQVAAEWTRPPHPPVEGSLAVPKGTV
jgi:HD domain